MAQSGRGQPWRGVPKWTGSACRYARDAGAQVAPWCTRWDPYCRSWYAACRSRPSTVVQPCCVKRASGSDERQRRASTPAAQMRSATSRRWSTTGRASPGSDRSIAMPCPASEIKSTEGESAKVRTGSGAAPGRSTYALRSAARSRRRGPPKAVPKSATCRPRPHAGARSPGRPRRPALTPASRGRRDTAAAGAGPRMASECGPPPEVPTLSGRVAGSDRVQEYR